jgi:3-phenylpropionate/cinnamic acid dioxygenase small subunit
VVTTNPSQLDASSALRLQELEDERAILQVLYKYCHYLDYGLEEQWMNCFTDDAVWSWTVRDEMVQAALLAQGLGKVEVGTPGFPPALTEEVLKTSFVGAEQLRKMVAGHTNAPERWHKHCVSNTLLTLSGDTASANSYFVRVDASMKVSSSYIRAFGRYLDDLVRCDDGAWRIRRRHCELESHFDETMLGI